MKKTIKFFPFILSLILVTCLFSTSFAATPVDVPPEMPDHLEIIIPVDENGNLGEPSFEVSIGGSAADRKNSINTLSRTKAHVAYDATVSISRGKAYANVSFVGVNTWIKRAKGRIVLRDSSTTSPTTYLDKKFNLGSGALLPGLYDQYVSFTLKRNRTYVVSLTGCAVEYPDGEWVSIRSKQTTFKY